MTSGNPRATTASTSATMSSAAVHLRAARARHHAEAADEVAALHGGDVGAHRVRVRGDRIGHVEGVGAPVEIDRHAPGLGGLVEELGDATERVRAHHDVYLGRARHHRGPLELATQPPTPIRSPGRPFFIRPSRTRDWRNLCEAFSRTAQVLRKTKSAVWASARLVAARLEEARDLLGVVHVHLAAEGLDEVAFFGFHLHQMAPTTADSA